MRIGCYIRVSSVLINAHSLLFLNSPNQPIVLIATIKTIGAKTLIN